MVVPLLAFMHVPKELVRGTYYDNYYDNYGRRMRSYKFPMILLDKRRSRMKNIATLIRHGVS